MNIYCGNNGLDENLVNGNIILGSRYKCLRKGIGTGLRLPYDNKYNMDYEPIDKTKMYCGDKDILPDRYDIFGNLPQCLQKGVAIGKRQKALKGEPFLDVLKNKKYTYYYRFVLWLFISLIIFLLLYYLKPNFVLKNEDISINKNQKIIDWMKFLLIYFLLIIPLFIIIFVINI